MKALQFNVTGLQFIVLKTPGSLNKCAYYNGALSTLSIVDLLELSISFSDRVKFWVYGCGMCTSDSS